MGGEVRLRGKYDGGWRARASSSSFSLPATSSSSVEGGGGREERLGTSGVCNCRGFNGPLMANGMVGRRDNGSPNVFLSRSLPGLEKIEERREEGA